LNDAYAWIARDSKLAGERLLERIQATVARLEQYPMTGTARQHLALDLRSIRVRPFKHLIFYRITRDELVLVRLLHGARALEEQDYQP
jgi:plasmid stabilization system protein ParE